MDELKELDKPDSRPGNGMCPLSNVTDGTMNRLRLLEDIGPDLAQEFINGRLVPLKKNTGAVSEWTAKIHLRARAGVET